MLRLQGRDGGWHFLAVNGAGTDFSFAGGWFPLLSKTELDGLAWARSSSVAGRAGRGPISPQLPSRVLSWQVQVSEGPGLEGRAGTVGFSLLLWKALRHNYLDPLQVIQKTFHRFDWLRGAGRAQLCE